MSPTPKIISRTLPEPQVSHALRGSELIAGMVASVAQTGLHWKTLSPTAMLFPRRPEILEPSAADCAEQLPPHVHEIRGARDELLWFDEEQALSALPSARPTVQLSGRSNPLPVPVAMAKP
jgi:hypothetical protein